MFLRFWRGRCSLALSFWVVAPLVAVLAFALPEGVGSLVRGQDFNPSLIPRGDRRDLGDRGVCPALSDGRCLQQRELALTDRMLRSAGVRAPPLPKIVPLANSAVFEALSAQFDTPMVNLLTDPAKVQPREYDLFCRVAVARFRAIAALPARQAGELMSSIFNAARSANR